jgi:hypothetical protein
VSMCEGFFTRTTTTLDGAGVAKYHGGVEGADAFSLGTEPCVHRAFLSVSIRALLSLCQ